MTSRRKVFFVSYRFDHHASHSGYDQLIRYASGVITARPLSKRIIRHKLMWFLANGVKSYDWASMALELKAASHILGHREGIYHILYGERIFHYLGLLNGWRGNRVIATFHQPLKVIKEIVQTDWHIRQLSAVICVGRNQCNYFADLLGPEKVAFIPHGVNTEYFSPPENFEERQSQMCLFVGDWLRDFPTLRGVIELVCYLRPATSFIAVTPGKNSEKLGFHPNLTYRSGISDSELLELYRSATLLVLPCIDCTANNALLEGLACGLPTVATDVGAVRDYVNNDCAVLVPPHDSLCMANAILSLLDDPQTRKTLSERARRESLKFSWSLVFEQVQTFCQSLD